MTLNDMLEAGIVLQEMVSVVGIDGYGDEHLFYEGVDEWRCPLDDGWANAEVRHMFAIAEYEMKLRIEVDYSESGTEWACANCADYATPEDGPILDYEGGWWTCPKCGCITCAPEEDACYRIG